VASSRRQDDELGTGTEMMTGRRHHRSRAIMTTETPSISTGHQLQLLDQTIVVIGRQRRHRTRTARHARAEGANVILTGRRDPDRLYRAALDVGEASSGRRSRIPVPIRGRIRIRHSPGPGRITASIDELRTSPWLLWRSATEG
jgi:hypothetical protein